MNQHRGGALHLGLDLTGVFPFESAGVEHVSVGLLKGIIAADANVAITLFVSTGSEVDWGRRLAEDGLSEIAFDILGVRMLYGRRGRGADYSRVRWRIRSYLKRSILQQRLVDAIRTLRRRRAVRASGVEVCIQPFHRQPVAWSRTVLILHDLRVFSSELRDDRDRRMITRNVKASQRIVCSWRHPYDEAIRLFPESADKFSRVPLPVLYPPSRPRSGGRKRSNAVVRLLYVSATVPHKNHRTLVEAMALLPNCELDLAGPPAEPIFSELGMCVRRLGLDGRVHLHGYVSGQQLEQLYSRADVVVVPTLWEAASGNIFEAVAREIPICCSDIPPLRAQAEDLNLPVRYFAPKNAGSIATAIHEVLRDQTAGSRRRSAARERVLAVTWEDVGRAYLAEAQRARCV